MAQPQTVKAFSGWLHQALVASRPSGAAWVEAVMPLYENSDEMVLHVNAGTIHGSVKVQIFISEREEADNAIRPTQG